MAAIPVTPRWVLLLYTSCLLTGFAMFLRGFLVLKVPIPGHATWGDFSMDFTNNQTEDSTGQSEMRAGHRHAKDDTGRQIKSATNTEPPFPAQFQRLVVVLVDALRADFVLPLGVDSSLSHMGFVRGMIAQNKTLSFLAKAHPPTVTLPRIKALTTGDIPGFVDVILNFDSTELKEDNLISQFRRYDKKMVFYGDDTWLKLFPDHFLRKEGTTSFFVTDYTEVDENVTRHLGKELHTTDWDALILHYLGLDHIGHLAGPRSPLVQPKLTEMDGVIKEIYHALLEQDQASGIRSLLLLCGDHGMSDQGSHGGSSAHEVNTPFVMMSSRWDDGTGLPFFEVGVEQVDAVPTLALLFGLPIPKNSLGVVIIPALSGSSAIDEMAALYVNVQQLVRVFTQNVADYERDPCYKAAQWAMATHQTWLSGGARADRVGTVHTRYTHALHKMRERLTASLTTYDLHAMGAGLLLLWVACLSVLLSCVTGETLVPACLGVMLLAGTLGATGLGLHIILCTGPHASPHLCTPNAIAMATTLGYFLLLFACLGRLCMSVLSFQMAKLRAASGLSVPCWFLLTGTVGHALSLAASSLVEEEHQTWYLLTTTVCLLVGARATMRGIPYTPTNQQYACSEGGQKDGQEEPNAYHQMQEMSALHTQCFTRTNPAISPRMPINPEEADVGHPGDPGAVGRVAALLGVLVVARVARSLNQTGDKWAHLQDMGDWLVDPSHKGTLSVVVALALCGVVAVQWRRGSSWMCSNFLVAGCSGVFCYRAATGMLLLPGIYGATVEKGLLEARMVWALVATMLVHAVVHYQRAADDETGSPHHAHANSPPSRRTTLMVHVQMVWTLIVLLVLRPHNVPLVFLVSIMEVCLRRALRPSYTLPTWATTLLYLWMGQAAFFYQGNSNSISSVDVSAGYIGVESYSPILITTLMCLSTYAGPIYWMLGLLRLLSERTDAELIHSARWRQVLGEVGAVWLGARSLPLAAYSVLTTGQRYHLFVWTVFSPKLLYEGMLTVVTAGGVLLLQLLHLV